jgi:hypothetical protein
MGPARYVYVFSSFVKFSHLKVVQIKHCGIESNPGCITCGRVKKGSCFFALDLHEKCAKLSSRKNR